MYICIDLYIYIDITKKTAGGRADDHAEGGRGGSPRALFSLPKCCSDSFSSHVCVCIYIYIYIHIYIFAIICVYVCICIYVDIYIYVIIYRYTYVCIYIYIHIESRENGIMLLGQFLFTKGFLSGDQNAHLRPRSQ